jgi:hypothetical protein
VTLHPKCNFSTASNQYKPRREALDMHKLIQIETLKENGRLRNEGIYDGQYVNLKEILFRVISEFFWLQ